ncbi:MAG: rhomboid family intramembrane serine protease [Bacteroidetes bacterium]|nr:rhomboid family intramembrane serine protease [Bacteroidota bacterium]
MLQQFRPNRFSKGVLNLVIINSIVFLATMAIGDRYGVALEDKFALYFPIYSEFRWYQLITHMFMHGGFFHIFLNMYGLWLFGSKLESVWGTQRFLLYYFVCGVGAFLLHWIMGFAGFISPSPIIGASGAISGLVVAYGFLFANSEFMIMPIPIPIKAKYLALLLGAYDLIFGLIGTDNNKNNRNSFY